LLRNRKCYGEKFRREVPIPPYTVDFCCIDLKVVIEVDGQAHFTDAGKQRDRERDKFLASLGFRVLRIPGYELIREAAPVLKRLRAFVASAMDAKAPLPSAP